MTRSVTDARVTRDPAGVDRPARVEPRSSRGAAARVVLDLSHPGETKDVEVRLADGEARRADPVAGHEGHGVAVARVRGRAGGVRDGGAGGPAGAVEGPAALEPVDAAYRGEPVGVGRERR